MDAPGFASVTGWMSGGDMTPLHAHEDDETLQVVEGRVTLYAGDEIVYLTAGSSVLVPAGVPHTCRADSERVRFHARAVAVSVSRYEDFLRAVGRPAASGGWATPEDEAAVTAIAAPNRITVLGPPGALPLAR